jgi:plasmid stability protein
MAVAITVRDVPDDVRDELAARAARAHQSLQEYLRSMLVDSAARPPVADVIARARARVEVTGTTVSAKSILDARDADRR